MKKIVLMLALVSCQAQALDPLGDDGLAKEGVPIPAGRAKAIMTALEGTTTVQQLVPEVLNKDIHSGGGLQIEPPPPPINAEQVWNH